MTHLEEIQLNCDDFEMSKRFLAIRESNFILKKLKVNAEFLNMAKEIFKGSDVICESF